MIHLGINECLGNIKRTVIMVLMMTFLGLLGMLLLGTYELQSRRYNPFKNLLSGKGIVCELIAPDVNDYGTVENMISQMIKVEDYEYTMNGNILSETGNELVLEGLGKRSASYEPALREGVWFTNADQKGMINAVISGPRAGHRVGDIIEIKNENEEAVKIYICGMLDEEAPVFGTHSYYKNYSIFDLYTVYNSGEESAGNTLFMDRDDMISNKLGSYWGTYIIKYSDDITDLERRKNASVMKVKGMTYQTEDIRERSLYEIRKRVGTILPVCIGAAILVGFGSACLIALDTKSRLGRYAIYFCSGMRWSQCIVINVIETLMCSAISLLLVVLTGNIFKLTMGKNMILFSIGKEELFMFGILSVYMLILSVIVPAVIIHGRPPKDVLREADV